MAGSALFLERMTVLYADTFCSEICRNLSGESGSEIHRIVRDSRMCRKVAYQSELRAELSRIHNTLHVSQLWKCLAYGSAHRPIDDIQVEERLNYVERPIAVLERRTKTLRNKEVSLVKVQWEHRKGSEWTWELEDEMRRNYPELFRV
ncbi:hypothetical protein OSB04_023112 [Centaurea solstitialis]|uniref:Chromo domain-containing protein n=1 Tax=Centaurea solstitialis TaxID=347529 RepID=A0AA38SIJ8_9ASTR|nr:hypothetical protein OSB04_023112 [Centaurea solstitialis]